MEVRTYKGRQMSEVMARIRKDLGEDAYILSTNQTADNSIEVSVGLEVSRARRASAKNASKKAATKDSARKTAPVVAPDSGEELLLAQGLSADVCQQVISAINPELLSNEQTSSEQLIADGLGRVLEFDTRFYGSQKVVAFIGATGVGKTTTIAKLAARMRMSFGLNIGLISADSYKVGAGMHLQTYAQMIGVPCQVLKAGKDEASELKRMLAEYRNMDLVLIDTAGCSVREVKRIEAMQRALQGLQQIEKILLLPAPSNDFDLKASVKAFDRLNPSRLIITKLDESGYIGPVLNTAISTGKPLAFLTTGQRVPEDIEPASAHRLGWMLTRTMH